MRCVDCYGLHARVVGFERGVRRCLPCANLYREVPVSRSDVTPLKVEAETFDLDATLDRMFARFDLTEG